MHDQNDYDRVRNALVGPTNDRSLSAKLQDGSITLPQLEEFLAHVPDEEAAALGPILKTQLEKASDVVCGASDIMLRVMEERPIFHRDMEPETLAIIKREFKELRKWFRGRRNRFEEARLRVDNCWGERSTDECIDQLGRTREVLNVMAKIGEHCTLPQALLHVNCVAFARVCHNHDHPQAGKKKTAEITLGDWKDALERVKQGVPVPAPLRDGALGRINARLGRFAQFEQADGTAPARHQETWVAVDAAAREGIDESSAPTKTVADVLTQAGHTGDDEDNRIRSPPATRAAAQAHIRADKNNDNTIQARTATRATAQAATAAHSYPVVEIPQTPSQETPTPETTTPDPPTPEPRMPRSPSPNQTVQTVWSPVLDITRTKRRPAPGSNEESGRLRLRGATKGVVVRVGLPTLGEMIRRYATIYSPEQIEACVRHGNVDGLVPETRLQWELVGQYGRDEYGEDIVEVDTAQGKE